MNVSHLAIEDNDKVRQRILDEVRDILLEALTPDQITDLVDQDMDAMERAAQLLLRLIGGRLMATLVEVSVLRHVGPPPICPRCSRPMRLVDRHRERKMHGLVGDFAYGRPYFHCRACGGAVAPDDERFGVGAISYTPALSRVAAAQVVDVPFERAAGKLSETLGANFCEADLYRAVESLGVVAESEIRAEMAMPAAPPPAPDGDTLVSGVDGTTSFIEGAWREVKVGVVGTLGPETKCDPNTGRELLTMKNPIYCAAAYTEADAFLPRFLETARQAGYGHPDVRRVVFINDGGPWIWNRGSQLDQEGVERIGDPGLARGECFLRSAVARRARLGPASSRKPPGPRPRVAAAGPQGAAAAHRGPKGGTPQGHGLLQQAPRAHALSAVHRPEAADRLRPRRSHLPLRGMPTHQGRRHALDPHGHTGCAQSALPLPLLARSLAQLLRSSSTSQSATCGTYQAGLPRCCLNWLMHPPQMCITP